MSEDTGLRISPSGAIYVDRVVFYSRPMVVETIKKMFDDRRIYIR